jgi:hypothetical protein
MECAEHASQIVLSNLECEVKACSLISVVSDMKETYDATLIYTIYQEKLHERSMSRTATTTTTTLRKR